MSFTWADRFILILGSAEVARIGDTTEAILSEIQKLQLNAKERDEAAECVQEIYAASRRSESESHVFDKYAKLKANLYLGAWSTSWFAGDPMLYDRYSSVNEHGRVLVERLRRTYDDDVVAGRVVYHIAARFNIKESLGFSLYQYYGKCVIAYEKTLYEWTVSSFGFGKPKITFFAPALSACWVLAALVLLVMYPSVWTFLADVAVFFLVWYWAASLMVRGHGQGGPGDARNWVTLMTNPHVLWRWSISTIWSGCTPSTPHGQTPTRASSARLPTSGNIKRAWRISPVQSLVEVLRCRKSPESASIPRSDSGLNPPKEMDRRWTVP